VSHLGDAASWYWPGRIWYLGLFAQRRVGPSEPGAGPERAAEQALGSCPSRPASTQGSREGEIFMKPEEAQIGKRVKVRKDHRKSNFRGQEGTIVKRWGNPGYPALDVLLDDGDWQLFWFHELEEVDEDDRGARLQNRATAGA
jgi:hypothetical protein